MVNCEFANFSSVRPRKSAGEANTLNGIIPNTIMTETTNANTLIVFFIRVLLFIFYLKTVRNGFLLCIIST